MNFLLINCLRAEKEDRAALAASDWKPDRDRHRSVSLSLVLCSGLTEGAF